VDHASKTREKEIFQKILFSFFCLRKKKDRGSRGGEFALPHYPYIAQHTDEGEPHSRLSGDEITVDGVSIGWRFFECERRGWRENA